MVNFGQFQYVLSKIVAWMSKPESDFPTLTIDDIELSKSYLDESEKEIFTIKPNEKTCL